MLTVAIDSAPLAESLHKTYDYSGLQVYGLTQTTLGDLHSRNLSQITAESASFEIPDDVRWSNTEKVLPEDYKRSIEELIEHNFFISKVLLRNLSKIETRGNKIDFLFSRPHAFLEDIFSIPNFCPLANHSSQFSGEYDLIKENDGLYLVDKAKKKKMIKFIQIKEPAENKRMLSKVAHFFTADTAFDFSCQGGTPVDTGLEFKIRFGKNLESSSQKKLRQAIKEVVESIDLTQIFGEYTDRPAKEKALIKDAKLLQQLDHLKIAYDNFYPNKDLVILLQSKLKSHGVKVVLVEDNYYKPYVDYDLKLSIERPLGPSEYLKKAAQLLSPILQNFPGLWKHYAQELFSSEMTGQLSSDLNRVLNEIQTGVDICPLPSIYETNSTELNPIYKSLRIH